MMITNSPMLIVRGPMGRDIAAFTDPVDAINFAISKDRVNHDLKFIYVRPDGQSTRLANYGGERGNGWFARAQQEFIAWATEGAD